jgi:phospholipase/carboxylesterase
VRQAASRPRGALVLFHGRGADENDMYPLLDELDPRHRLLGVALRGTLALPPGGFHWYVSRAVGYPDPETFLSTFRRVGGWLDTLTKETGIPAERVVLGGFSQGAVMSYAFGLGEERPRPAAVIALSGFIPTVPGFTLNLTPPLPPVAIGHGVNDPVISVEFARRARDVLEGAGATVLYREAPIPHAVDPAFLGALTVWIERICGDENA